MINHGLKKKVDSLPEAPGVYIFKDAGGNIIYIGKAKILKKRVQSYFHRFLSGKTQALVSRITDLEYILTPTEFQAQLLEASLIKEKQPVYNISLKDDKSFPLIRISGDEFPVITICRDRDTGKRRKDAAVYYGPYANSRMLRQALKAIRKIFGFRTCATMPRKPCLYYRLRLCPAPCAGRISRREYAGIIQDIRLFLDSKYEELVDKLSFEMRRASEERRFEDAAALRDRVFALCAIGKDKVRFTSADELEDLKNLARLKAMPLRIEGFDISNISGQEATGSMVSFYKGAPDKKNYRRFRIKTVSGIDDYAMIREVVRRRYSRLAAEKKELPDLILIDGGRQHLTAALETLEGVGVSCPVLSIAKEGENLYIKGMEKPVRLAYDTPALNLIRRVRDEAHRFAREYHHLLHKKKTFGL
ncbi:MAG TPA: excinuclease ABC subunit UvrC [Candidatus Omnitrophota bacterium]|nr:excinuclease ABC subunit UvrC [Candidatus Omnitrophota bacterium]